MNKFSRFAVSLVLLGSGIFLAMAMAADKSSTDKSSKDKTALAQKDKAAAGIDAKVDSLLKQMTLDEKIGQMTQVDSEALVKHKDDVAKYFLGSVLSGGGSDPPKKDNTAQSWANFYDSFQKQALKTRLKIPIIYGVDVIHGHSNIDGAVLFPHNIGMGATRNPDLV
ncbi:MAG TPA: glycoside hydrolase family 3 N-terminal domain-containing protein, partial [Pirellulales bacterium]